MKQTVGAWQPYRKWTSITCSSSSLILKALSSRLSRSSGITLNKPSYSRRPIIRHSGSTIPMIPVSDGRPIRSCREYSFTLNDNQLMHHCQKNTAQQLLPLFRVITESKAKNLMMKMFFKKSCSQFYTISSTFSAVGVIVGWERQWGIFKSLQTYINVHRKKKNKQTKYGQITSPPDSNDLFNTWANHKSSRCCHTHLDVSVSPRDDVDAFPVLFVF